jgi:hypothetical protein
MHCSARWLCDGTVEVLRWLATVEGLTGPQLATTNDRVEEEGEDTGRDLLGFTERTLPRLRRGTSAVEAASLLVAARDAFLARDAAAAAGARRDEEAELPEVLAGVRCAAGAAGRAAVQLRQHGAG